MGHHKRKGSYSTISSHPLYRRRYRDHSRYTKSVSSLSTNSAVTNSSEQKWTSKNQSRPNRAWENIVLHYLSKLKNYWCPGYSGQPEHPQAGTRDTSEMSFRKANEINLPPEKRLHEPDPDKYTPKNMELLEKRKSSTNPDMIIPMRFENTGAARKKAVNIVTNAIEYGLVNGIVSKNGNYFWMNNINNVSNPNANNAMRTVSTALPIASNRNMMSKTNFSSLSMSDVEYDKPNITKKKVVKSKKKTVKALKTKVNKARKFKKITRIRSGVKKNTVNLCKCKQCKSLLSKLKLFK